MRSTVLDVTDLENVLLIDVQVDGKPYDPFAAPACAHRTFHHENAVVTIEQDGMVVARQLQARLVCAECGALVAFKTAEDGRVGALSPDGRTLSAVLDL